MDSGDIRILDGIVLAGLAALVAAYEDTATEGFAADAKDLGLLARSDKEVAVDGFVLPHLGGTMTVTHADGRREVTRFDATTTYEHQLRRFAELVRAGRPMPTDLADSVATAALLDDARRLVGRRAR